MSENSQCLPLCFLAFHCTTLYLRLAASVAYFSENSLRNLFTVDRAFSSLSPFRSIPPLRWHSCHCRNSWNTREGMLVQEPIAAQKPELQTPPPVLFPCTLTFSVCFLPEFYPKTEHGALKSGAAKVHCSRMKSTETPPSDSIHWRWGFQSASRWLTEVQGHSHFLLSNCRAPAWDKMNRTRLDGYRDLACAPGMPLQVVWRQGCYTC